MRCGNESVRSEDAWREPVKDIQQFDSVCVGLWDRFVCSSLHRGSGSKSNLCVCVSGQTDLGTGDVSGFEMHGFSTAATGHVSFPDESEETPTRCPRPSL